MRRRSIRLRIVLLVAIPILSLIGVYAFAATVTASAAINLAKSRSLKNTIGTPTGNLEAQIDAERLIAVVYLAAPVPSNLAALHAQEAKTEQAQAAFETAVHSTATTSGAVPAEKQAIAALVKQTAGLPTLRSSIASQSITRPQAITAYGNVISAADIVLNQAILQETNVPLVTQSLALVRTGRSEEILLEEDALLNGDAIARTFSVADRQEFAQLVGAHRALYSQTLPDLQPTYRAFYLRDISPQASAALTALENKVIADNHPGRVPPVPLPAWNLAVGAVSAGLSNAGMQAATALTTAAQPVANSTFLRLFLVGGLGLLAIIVSILVSVWIGRGLVRQLGALRRSALELANERLPSLVERLRAGQDVDIAAEAPPMETSSDEIGQVREAFNAVQRTAVEAAVDEARLRRGISDVFRNLARRSQSLLHRQLALLDAMERRASEPEELEDLFRIDHLTTRMRRHSEGLIILSGDSPGRGWRHPVPFVDVLRAAVAEVEDYQRIRVTTGTRAALIGPAVADVIHLIAELAENATIFSPPNSPVRIHGDIVGRGYAVEIEDRGLGIPDEKLAEANSNLTHPPQFDLSGSEQLGLFVAGQLARRHDIRITLQGSPFGGTTAIVLIPTALVVNEGAYDPQLPAAAEGERPLRLPGRQSARGAIVAETTALAQPSALTSAAEPPPGPPSDLPSRLATGLAGPPAGLPASPADLPSRRAAGLQASPAAGLPATNGADPPAIPAAETDSVFTPRRRPAAPSPSGTFPFGTSQPPRPAASPINPFTFGSEPPPFAAEPPPFGSEPPFAAEPPPFGSEPPPFGSEPPFAAEPPPFGSEPPFAAEPPPVPAEPPPFAAEPPAQALGGEGTDGRVTTTELTAMGLPIRVRQASLAPQLRDGGSRDGGAPEADPSAPSPEAARSTMTALQRGWERGRYITGAVTPPPETTLSPDGDGNGGEPRNDE
ncbi:MAG TPA: nitrate- and nitrite sensing domain-containing protein [Streptosporangiaceae bacterium]|nr:nitrate- and nitrite sensing domain-containing protein [Streptosporangiaceae bacterium]